MNIDDELSSFSRCRAKTLELTDSLNQQQLNYSPRDDKWSVGEVLHHLFLTEKTYRDDLAQLIELKKKGKRGVVNRSFSEIDLRFMFLPEFVMRLGEVPIAIFSSLMPRNMRNFLIRNRLVPFQNPSIASPRQGIAGDELRKMLTRSLAETEKLIRSNRSLNYNSMIHKHPILGVNTAPQLIHIQTLHEERHQAQIREIKGDRDFPSSR